MTQANLINLGAIAVAKISIVDRWSRVLAA
jgi:hypothetical protein